MMMMMKIMMMAKGRRPNTLMLECYIVIKRLRICLKLTLKPNTINYFAIRYRDIIIGLIPYLGIFIYLKNCKKKLGS